MHTIGLAPPFMPGAAKRQVRDSQVPDDVLAQLDAIYAALQEGSQGTGCDPVTGERLAVEATSEGDG